MNKMFERFTTSFFFKSFISITCTCVPGVPSGKTQPFIISGAIVDHSANPATMLFMVTHPKRVMYIQS
jgi:hypothetical protein